MTTSSELEQAWSVLADPGASFVQVQKSVALLEASSTDLLHRKLALSSNVQVDRLALYLRRYALRAGIRLEVTIGSYDNLLQDADRFALFAPDIWLILPFFDNLLPAFEAQIEAGLGEAAIEARQTSFSEQYRFALEIGLNIPQVLVCDLHRVGSPAQLRRSDRTESVLRRFRAALAETVQVFPNTTLIDLEPAIQAVGLRVAIDRRFYAQAKAPYALPMLDEIARRIAEATRGYGQWFYKVLALDCDNTLWGGVVGEDLLSGIKLSPYDYPGSIYWRIQQEIIALERMGVILCLCTKNNPNDVEEVLINHPHMLIRSDDITLKMVNWDDKISNLRAIAEHLNIGLDSIIFLDDSPYELEGVRAQLPEVTVFQVPSTLSDYPAIIERIKALFLAGGISDASVEKKKQYKQKISAEGSRSQFGSQEEFLYSLNLRVSISRDSACDISRISELSQKSNQFNLTTRRYTVGEISNLMSSDNHVVYSFVVEDKFGSAGLTGVAVIAYEGDVARVEAFLMSCRVIGRGVEFAIWAMIARHASDRGCSRLVGLYRQTTKNALVERFFDQLGLDILEENHASRIYEASLAHLDSQKSPWIEVVSVG